jgi:hypothetical protein
MPLTGLPTTDERVRTLLGPGERELMQDGFVTDKPRAASMGCRAEKVFFFPVLFGWRIVGTCSAEKRKRASYSGVCLICATISAFFQKNTILAESVSSEIFRRLFRTSRSLVRQQS